MADIVRSGARFKIKDTSPCSANACRVINQTAATIRIGRYTGESVATKEYGPCWTC